MKARHKDTGEIIELAEEGIISCDGRRFCWYQVELIPDPIDDFKPSLPSNLDEAAEKIVVQLHPCMEYSSVLGDRLTKGELVELVKAGAQWRAAQIPKLQYSIDEAALKAYPKMSRLSEPHGVIPADNKTHYLGDANEENRAAFKAGAEWQKRKMMEKAVEVDLKEEIASFFSKNPIPYEHITDWPLLKNTALHFFKLGKLSARKEENK